MYGYVSFAVTLFTSAIAPDSPLNTDIPAFCDNHIWELAMFTSKQSVQGLITERSEERCVYTDRCVKQFS
jgi:hypothetical protein